MKRITTGILAMLLGNVAMQAQTNFSGKWIEPEFEMVSGKQYSNAVPKEITVTQSKDSIKLETIEVGDNATPFMRALALNGKTVSRTGKTSKRTIKTTAKWSSDKKTLTISTTYSYAEKPEEIEYNNTEVWELTSDGSLLITKTSDATVTDDWTIKATYKKD